MTRLIRVSRTFGVGRCFCRLAVMLPFSTQVVVGPSGSRCPGRYLCSVACTNWVTTVMMHGTAAGGTA